jgi:hypothetical protein
VVKGLQAQGETERRGRVWWSLGDFEGYRVHYRKTGKDYQWFPANVRSETFKAAGGTEGEVKLYDLEPDTQYEARVQGKKNGYLGPYSEIVQFRTPARRVVQCGEATKEAPEMEMGKPLLGAIKGNVVEADGIEMTLVAVWPLSEPGWYQGTGRINIAFLGGAAFPVQFERIYIREDRQVVDGRIDVVSEGVAALVEKQAANQARNNQEKIQEKNRAAWAGTNFYEKVFSYEQIVIDTLTVDRNGYLNITDKEGQTTVNAEVAQLLAAVPDQAILIQDQRGDQWVVKKDKASAKTTVTKVPGGGLSPGEKTALANADLNLLKKALREIRKENTSALVEATQKQKEASQQPYQRKIQGIQVRLIGIAPSATGIAPAPNGFSWEAEPEASSTGDGDLDRLAADYLKVEKALFLKKALYYVSDELLDNREYALVAADLVVKDKKLPDYIAQKRQANASDADMIADIKAAVVTTVQTLIENKYE